MRNAQNAAYQFHSSEVATDYENFTPQDDSPFFSKLPLEIRRLIYKFAFDVAGPKPVTELPEGGRFFYDSYASFWGDRDRWELFEPCQRFKVWQKLRLACKRLNHEVDLVPFEDSHFIVHSVLWESTCQKLSRRGSAALRFCTFAARTLITWAGNPVRLTQTSSRTTSPEPARNSMAA